MDKISWNQKIWDTEINLEDPNLIELNLEINEDWRGGGGRLPRNNLPTFMNDIKILISKLSEQNKVFF